MPTEEQIRNALLQQLYRQESYSLRSQQAADEIDFEYFSISEKDRNEKFANSKSKWKNRVQVVRNLLVAEGILLPTKISGRDVWKLSEKGIAEAKRIWLQYNEDDPHADILTTQVNQDIKDFMEEEGQGEREGEAEGGAKKRFSNYYERKPILRVQAIKIHGLICKICGFNFENTYGEIGRDFIEVHHLVPLSTYNEAKIVNPKLDMTVLCSNCHRMIHRKLNGVEFSVDELSKLLRNRKEHQ